MALQLPGRPCTPAHNLDGPLNLTEGEEEWWLHVIIVERSSPGRSLQNWGILTWGLGPLADIGERMD